MKLLMLGLAALSSFLVAGGEGPQCYDNQAYDWDRYDSCYDNYVRLKRNAGQCIPENDLHSADECGAVGELFFGITADVIESSREDWPRGCSHSLWRDGCDGRNMLFFNNATKGVALGSGTSSICTMPLVPTQAPTPSPTPAATEGRACSIKGRECGGGNSGYFCNSTLQQCQDCANISCSARFIDTHCSVEGCPEYYSPCCVFPGGGRVSGCEVHGDVHLGLETDYEFVARRIGAECGATEPWNVSGSFIMNGRQWFGRRVNSDPAAMPWNESGAFGCATTAFGTVASGTKCAFPFEFGGATYHACTTDGYGKQPASAYTASENNTDLRYLFSNSNSYFNPPWCSTTREFENAWGRCECGYGSVERLKGITFIGKELKIFDFGDLRSLEGFESLRLLGKASRGTFKGASLILRRNDALANLTALSGVVGGLAGTFFHEKLPRLDDDDSEILKRLSPTTSPTSSPTTSPTTKIPTTMPTPIPTANPTASPQKTPTAAAAAAGHTSAAADDIAVSIIAVVSAAFGVLVLAVFGRLVVLRVGRAAIKRAALRFALCRCRRSSARRGGAGAAPDADTYVAPVFASRIPKKRLAFLLLSGCDLITDLAALTALDADHLPWGYGAMAAALTTNLLIMKCVVFRIASARRLLDAKSVRHHLWEHAILTLVGVSNLDTLNLLHWRDSRFNGFPLKRLSWLTAISCLVENVPQPVEILQNTFSDRTRCIKHSYDLGPSFLLSAPQFHGDRIAIQISNASATGNMNLLVISSVTLSMFSIVLKMIKLAFLTQFSGFADFRASLSMHFQLSRRRFSFTHRERPRSSPPSTRQKPAAPATVELTKPAEPRAERQKSGNKITENAAAPGAAVDPSMVALVVADDQQRGAGRGEDEDDAPPRLQRKTSELFEHCEALVEDAAGAPPRLQRKTSELFDDCAALANGSFNDSPQ